MKKKMTKQECIRLLYLAIEYCIDLWIFRELFIKLDRDYNYYLENQKEISRIAMKQDAFKEVHTLLQKYCNG